MPTLKILIDDVLISEQTFSDATAEKEIEALKSKIATYEEAAQLASHAVDSLEARVTTLTKTLEEHVGDTHKRRQH